MRPHVHIEQATSQLINDAFLRHDAIKVTVGALVDEAAVGSLAAFRASGRAVQVGVDGKGADLVLTGPSDTADQSVTAALANPATSYWLTGALRSALQRDAVDALNDAEKLVELLSARVTGSVSQCPPRLQNSDAPTT